MWCPCLCQLPNRNSRTGKKFKFFSRIIISVQNIGSVGFLHTFAHSILYSVSDEKLKFVFQLMQNSCSDVYGWLQDATLKCAPDLLPRDDDIHARKICSDFDYSSFELTLERISFFWKAFDSLVYENILGIWHWMAESALADLPVNLITWISDIIQISSCQAKSFLSPQISRLKNKMRSNYLQHNTKNGSLLNLFDGTEATILPSPNSFPFPPLPPSPPHPPSPAMAQVLSLSLFLSSLFLSTSNFLKASLIFTFHSHPYRNQF